MTLIISWIGVDKKSTGNAISSLYIGTDSRYSWSDDEYFDYGTKVFGSQKYPEIFGFCGDVTFPSLIFGQLISQIDFNLLINEKDTCDQKNKKIFNYIKSSVAKYPTEHLVGRSTILHGTRFGKIFKLYKTTFNSKTDIINQEINLPKISTNVFSGGSGSQEFDNNWILWKDPKHNDFETSRAVYHCLDKTLNNIVDRRTGGLKQIIGLYRVKNAKLFGTIKNGKKYIYGKEITEDLISTNIEWRNENFERVNSITMNLIEGAQRQPI